MSTTKKRAIILLAATLLLIILELLPYSLRLSYWLTPETRGYTYENFFTIIGVGAIYYPIALLLTMFSFVLSIPCVLACRRYLRISQAVLLFLAAGLSLSAMPFGRADMYMPLAYIIILGQLATALYALLGFPKQQKRTMHE
ncbi:MAG: hypothetical protein LBM28_03070 [Oscillospiraceae bacterium]|jgi:hypothetical protein|nr:hypothetical protein [Oscillospiraceae bacterium]